MKAKKLSLKLHLQMYSLIYHVSFICTKEGLDRYITYVFYWKTKISQASHCFFIRASRALDVQVDEKMTAVKEFEIEETEC